MRRIATGRQTNAGATQEPPRTQSGFAGESATVPGRVILWLAIPSPARSATCAGRGFAGASWGLSSRVAVSAEIPSVVVVPPPYSGFGRSTQPCRRRPHPVQNLELGVGKTGTKIPTKHPQRKKRQKTGGIACDGGQGCGISSEANRRRIRQRREEARASSGAAWTPQGYYSQRPSPTHLGSSGNGRQRETTAGKWMQRGPSFLCRVRPLLPKSREHPSSERTAQLVGIRDQMET